MPKCICVRDCYIKHESPVHRHYVRGEVFNFQEVPPHFMAVEQALEVSEVEVPVEKTAYGQPNEKVVFDFHTANEELLLAADYDTNLLRDYALKNYGIAIPDDSSKAVIVAKFVDARYRYSTAASALLQASTPPAANEKGKK